MLTTLDDITSEVDSARPDLIDRWEAAAVIESLGFSDARVSAEFGFPTTLALGEHIVGRQNARGPRVSELKRQRFGVGAYVRTAVSSLIYALPWICLFVAETREPDFLHLSPDAAGPLTVALMASLIVSGGFVQAIARRAQFYLGIQQPVLAREASLVLLYAGLASAIVVALLGVLLGWYFSLFAWPFLLLAATYFIVSTILWMQCALLGLASGGWRIPVVFAVAGSAFILARLLGSGTLIAQTIAASTAVLCAGAQIPDVFGRSAGRPEASADLARAHLGIVAHGLLPYFFYGVLYFTFLVVDRVSASAASAALGQGPFGVPLPYKQGMDVALMTFLIAAVATECCNLAFMRRWRSAADLPFEPGSSGMNGRLRVQRARILAVLIASFAISAVGVRAAAVWLTGRSLDGLAETVLIIGDLGYLLLSIGLFNALTLISVNRVHEAVRALAAAVVVNLVVGSILSHLLGTYFAMTGLTAGGAVFVVLTAREIRRTLTESDYAYGCM